MGTNFYWLDGEACFHCGRGAKEGDHIGKRSAAGLYCWDCDVTLCKGGADSIHHGDSPWFHECPRCDKEPAAKDGLKEGPVAVELGFAAPRASRPMGVRGASSFMWAIHPDAVRTRCAEHAERRIVVDEYGRVSTGREFLEMLAANCPIEFTNLVGVSFS